ncbi:MAG: hypothetical protein IPN75_08485 [Dechloromonas sp.]|uniref:Uncharacterized protein n=1 Tax=Candidatus Dechloromonas phosphorivorans TaxID=2899244 RepID=A0A9D7LU85_9RHOO|nr:hypothetical protein [Candidatus Dechloromonas phosphorivorans]
MLLLLRPADAFHHLLQDGKIATDEHGHFVEEAGGVHTAHIRLHLNLLLVEPVKNWPMLEYRGELVGVRDVDLIQRGGASMGCRLPGCNGPLEAGNFTLALEAFVEQPADEKHHAIDPGRVAAPGAGYGFTKLAVGVFLKMSALAAAENGHE